jgi:TDG/mug DNA glycosylase family protein
MIYKVALTRDAVSDLEQICRCVTPTLPKANANFCPDILASGLDVIFCGLNPALTAATVGHNFSSPSNRFWSVLHLAGFTDVRLRPEEERRVLQYGIGISAVVSRPTRRAAEISRLEFKKAGTAFQAKMRRWAPRVIAILGKSAYSAMTEQPDVPWGRQPQRFAGALVWILPNPSGLNRSFTLKALVGAYSELHLALAGDDL